MLYDENRLSKKYPMVYQFMNTEYGPAISFAVPLSFRQWAFFLWPFVLTPFGTCVIVNRTVSMNTLMPPSLIVLIEIIEAMVHRFFGCSYPSSAILRSAFKTIF